MTEPHPLLGYLLSAADGRYPPVDGGCTVLPALPGGLECSVAFTGHAVVATALPGATVHMRQPDGFGASLAPDFLRWLAGERGWIGVNDVVLVAATSACTATSAAWSPSPKDSPGGAR